MTTVRYGSRGSAVKTVQTILGGLTIDGIFGKKTRAAVKTYQTAQGLAADGIVGPLTWAALQGASVTGVRPPDNKQYDSRWGSVLYTSTGNKSQTIRSSGCGPTAMCNIVNAWFDADVTPVDLCKLAVANGYRTVNNGTAWAFFAYMFKQYEFTKFQQTGDHAAAIAALAQGALIIASMGPGYWTSGGHFITLWRCDGTYMYACDPASATRKQQKLTAFKKQVKKYFIFWPPLDVAQPESEIAPANPVEDKPRPTGIYDISKWQGKIDWPAVKASGKAALLIVRAGYGQNTRDQRFDEYMAGIKAQGIPFGVYWYSYATSADRARNEARSFFKIASPHKPLFYVMDAEEASLTGEMINAFARELDALGAGKTGAYIANHRFAAYKADAGLWRFIWIPRYPTEPTHRPLDLHQYGGSKVPGITGSVDTNRIPDVGRYTLDWFLEREED
jgi:GH25 family lysozyme M1 (1,4-beta-N-acetylmuramidase)